MILWFGVYLYLVKFSLMGRIIFGLDWKYWCGFIHSFILCSQRNKRLCLILLHDKKNTWFGSIQYYLQVLSFTMIIKIISSIFCCILFCNKNYNELSIFTFLLLYCSNYWNYIPLTLIHYLVVSFICIIFDSLFFFEICTY